jgi:hypothetical protein
MIDQAIRQNLGSARSLAHTFGNFQKRGLIGHASTKTSRRGGEGLWHPIQGALWIGTLTHRRQGVRLTTLANLPVGVWLLGVPGIDTQQAQRAFGFWAGWSNAPKSSDIRLGVKDPRALYQRAITARIDELASPAATSANKRQLRRLFEEILDTHPEIRIPQRQLVDSLRNVVLPTRSSDNVEAHLTGTANRFYIQASATKVLTTLLLVRPDVLAFWEWARRFVHAHDAQYDALVERVGDDPDLSRFYGPMELAPFLNTACSHVQTVMGIGVEILKRGRDSSDFEPPPAVEWR